jgi:hypothetical protein
VRKHVNPNFTISFDCASPFLASANGQIYIQTEIEDRKKWVYRMVPSVDNKKYALDTRKFSDAVLQDGIFANFTDSPISNRIKINDVCVYHDGVRKTAAELNGEEFDVTNQSHYTTPPALNKINKVGKTSWDSFAYAIQMGHNVWSHITSVQEANRQYDQGVVPNMLVQETFDRVYFKDVVNSIFAAPDRDTANQIIEDNSKFWMKIIGTRGATGKKTVNASTQFNSLFDTEEIEEHHIDDSGLDETTLDNLEADLGE